MSANDRSRMVGSSFMTANTSQMHNINTTTPGAKTGTTTTSGARTRQLNSTSMSSNFVQSAKKTTHLKQNSANLGRDFLVKSSIAGSAAASSHRKHNTTLMAPFKQSSA